MDETNSSPIIKRTLKAIMNGYAVYARPSSLFSFSTTTPRIADVKSHNPSILSLNLNSYELRKYLSRDIEIEIR